MKALRRRFWAIALIVLFLTASGCSDEPNAADQEAVIAAREDFRRGVEGFDLSLMTGRLSEGFVLTLKEGTLQYTKDLAKLRGELEQDEALQLYWRSEYGYQLELVFNSSGYGFYNGTHAEAHASFTVIESATGIPETVTDTGLIEMNLVQLGNTWRIADMTITFNTAQAAALRSTRSFPKNFFFGNPWR